MTDGTRGTHGRRRRGADVAGRPTQQPGADSQTGADADPESVARAICLRLLSAQPRTRVELARALDKRAVPADAATSVLDRFTEVGLIDDKAFAAAWVDSRHAGRGLARRALSAELHRRGVDPADAAPALEQVDADAERSTASALVARRVSATRGLPPEVRMRRLVGMLARKGYPPGLAVDVVRSALQADGAPPDDALEAGLDQASTAD